METCPKCGYPKAVVDEALKAINKNLLDLWDSDQSIRGKSDSGFADERLQKIYYITIGHKL